MALDVERLVGELTLDEKASLTSGSSFWWTVGVERLGIPSIMVSDGPHGLRTQPGVGDHVGLGGSVPATCFPTASATASAWDPELLRRIGAAIGREARATGVSVVLGPGVNIKRSPLCGRNFEYVSEDPYLSGELGAAITEGIQSAGVGTSLKHYAANNQEDDRQRVDVRVSERVLREIYLPAFERIVTGARPWTVMCSYNKVNGASASENTWLLTTVLREEWGFEGLVISDWGAVYHRLPALRAGLDLEMPPNPRSPGAVADAVQSGELEESALDDRVKAVLRLVDRAMQTGAASGAGEPFDVDAHHALAREAAAASVVLLKNHDGLLPLATGARVAVVGELARTPRFQGAGSSQVNPTRVDSILDAVTAAYPGAEYAAGYRVQTGFRPDPGDLDEAAAAALREEAVAAARDADVVVMVVGLGPAEEYEGFDRTHLDLPANQLATLRAVAEANAHIVALVVNGSAVLLGEVRERAQAVLECWLAGQAAGSGVVDVLTGVVNPSGRLAETVPRRLQDSPSFLGFPGDSSVVTYGEGLFVGYRGFDAMDREVEYPFGYGLSYTTFELSDLAVATSGSAVDGDLAATVEVTVTNTGAVEGAEVVQVYVRDAEATVARPVRELAGFAKVRLGPGDDRRVRIDLVQRAFELWSERLGRWAVEAGEFVVEVGRHSRDLPLEASVTVDAPPIALPLGPGSSLHEWVADPVGRVLLAEAAAQGVHDVLADEDVLMVIGSMPMSSLAAFDGMTVGPEGLDELVAEYRRRTATP
jgi:beta-glucosidase